MEVRAHLRYLRITPRKVRLVIGLVRGRTVEQAIDQLTVLPKGAARPVLKLLQSAVANAKHNFHLDQKTLKIKSIVANEGPRLKRYQPRAFGRAAEILKRSSHVTIVLEGKPAAGQAKEKTSAKPTPVTTKPANTKPNEQVVTPTTPKKPKSSENKSKERSAVDAVVRRQGKE